MVAGPVSTGLDTSCLGAELSVGAALQATHSSATTTSRGVFLDLILVPSHALFGRLRVDFGCPRRVNSRLIGMRVRLALPTGLNHPRKQHNPRVPSGLMDSESPGASETSGWREGQAETVVTTRARTTGSIQRRRERSSRADDHATQGTATSNETVGSDSCERAEKSRPVRVVQRASRAE